MTIDLDDLEAKARAASPGPWRWEGERLPDGSAEEGTIYAGELDSVVTGAVHCQAMASSADAAFIAAANPAAVLELVERVRAAEARGDHLTAWVGQQSVRARLALLESIVRDLVAKEPRAPGPDAPMSGIPHCALCGAVKFLPSGVHAHEEACPWRRAVEASKL